LERDVARKAAARCDLLHIYHHLISSDWAGSSTVLGVLFASKLRAARVLLTEVCFIRAMLNDLGDSSR
jgi:hypothetical protein